MRSKSQIGGKLISSLCLLGCIGLLLLQSCSGSKIGRELTDSFDDPLVSREENIDKNQKETKKKKKKRNSTSDNISSNLDDFQKKSNLKNNKKKRDFNSKRNINKNDFPNRSFIPQPYRITIRLKGTNPSSPAENLTRALRLAGVDFEVEKIERVEDKNSLINSIKPRGARR